MGLAALDRRRQAPQYVRPRNEVLVVLDHFAYDVRVVHDAMRQRDLLDPQRFEVMDFGQGNAALSIRMEPTGAPSILKWWTRSGTTCRARACGSATMTSGRGAACSTRAERRHRRQRWRFSPPVRRVGGGGRVTGVTSPAFTRLGHAT